MKTNYFKKSLQGAAFGLVVMTGLQACKKEDSTPATPHTPVANVKTSSNATLGSFMTDANGKTLYFFTKDVDGSSACKDGCLDAWPLFYEKELVVGDGLDKANFGVITRADGKKQTTYKGWPLYRFAQDAAAGDTKGNGVGTTWFVSNPAYTVFLADKDGSKFLVDATTGKSLYLFAKDTDDLSNCNGGCLVAWPEFFADKITVPSLLNASDFGTITRGDGKKQLTFKKKPLYLFANDAVRGDTKGKAVANWSLSNPAQ